MWMCVCSRSTLNVVSVNVTQFSSSNFWVLPEKQRRISQWTSNLEAWILSFYCFYYCSLVEFIHRTNHVNKTFPDQKNIVQQCSFFTEKVPTRTSPLVRPHRSCFVPGRNLLQRFCLDPYVKGSVQNPMWEAVPTRTHPWHSTENLYLYSSCLIWNPWASKEPLKKHFFKKKVPCRTQTVRKNP